MDTAEIAVLISGLGLIAGTLWFFFGTPKDEPQAAATGPLYECPMHPWVTSTDSMANCSICGMKLVRRGDDAPKHAPSA